MVCRGRFYGERPARLEFCDLRDGRMIPKARPKIEKGKPIRAAELERAADQARENRPRAAAGVRQVNFTGGAIIAPLRR